jgi:hypothetical protein
MNKTYKLSNIWMICLLLLSSISFTACDKDNLNTDQYGNDIALNSFGPCPVLRGGTLRFLGSNLDQITSISIPGADPITNITVVSKGEHSEITVQVPKENCTEGYVTLATPKGGTITTGTKITYSEPIIFTSFSPSTVMPGDVITITGDYLNLMHEVIFADNIVVPETQFISHTRYEIKVAVPQTARTGKVIISDAAEGIPNQMYSDTELTVALPTLTSISPNPLKAGNALTITGANFQLANKVILPGGEEVAVDISDVSVTKISVPTKATIKEGVVKLVAKSGVEISSATLNLVKPAVTSVSTSTPKNNTTFTINGTNLDLVSEVDFQGATVAAADFTSQSESKIELMMPATATDGNFTVKTLSETSADGKTLTFVKPTVTAFSASSIKAKETLTITGKDLDLVKKITFGTYDGTITSQTDTQIEVTVPVGAANGALVLTTVNGTQIKTTQTITINVTLPVITSIKSEGPGNKITITGTQLDLIKTIYLADASGNYTIKVTDYGTKNSTLVEFYHVLGAATGNITPKMVTFDGDEGFMPTVYCGSTDPITSATIMMTDFNGGGNSQSTWGSPFGFDIPSIKLDGTQCMIGTAGVSGWVWSWAANWGTLPSIADPSKYVFKMDICITKAASNVTAGLCLHGWDNALDLGHLFAESTNGHWVTKSFELNAGGLIDGTKDYGFYLSIDGTADLSGVFIDNFRFDPK